jgi:ribosome recycling factor
MSEEEILESADTRMTASVADGQKKLASVRTGRATISILDGITVDYYGTPSPLSQMAKLSVPDATMLVAQPFDPSVLPAIERAIFASGLGLNPSNDGKLIRIPIPPLTEERRKQMVKRVRGFSEETKTSVRLVRRDCNEEVKKLEKEGALSEDDARRRHDEIQKITDKHTSQIDVICKAKEQELMEI